jgi:ATP-dependent helicase/nuclease subunit A
MSRSPNSEQLLAIEHKGGVLLRAGAGSGKTFVLVEHIVYLTQLWVIEFRSMSSLNFEDFIRQKYSELVMMTFTKKAAGEMSIRLADRFEEMVLNATDENRLYWNAANEALPALSVTTIDGFCRRLIVNGYFPELSTEAKVIFFPERKTQVIKLIDDWIAKNTDQTSEVILEILIREREQLILAFCNIFNDPGLRLTWRKFSERDAHPDQLDKVIRESYELNNLEQVINLIHGTNLPEEDQSAFEKSMADLQATGLPEVTSFEQLKLYFTYFQGKTLRPEMQAKKKCPEYTAVHEGRKTLRDWVIKWYQAVVNYHENYSEKIGPWVNFFLKLYQWIDKHLDPNQGLTFGDIEYLVDQGLENQGNLARVHKAYGYFIVDEFQDTSALQFRIIQKLIGNDFTRLFCVGDAKQAIYGFRGGELSVFSDCSELVPQVHTLANNYRSLPNIIKFNNSLFQTVLPLGEGFNGSDPFTVKFEDQSIPSELPPSSTGSIEILSVEIDELIQEEDKFSSEQINRIEAFVLATAIEDHRKNLSENVCTILYSKLRPSLHLIRFLMLAKIGFTAQVKSDLLDDPVTGIFLVLLKREFDNSVETRDEFSMLMITSYFDILGVKRDVQKEALQIFSSDIFYWGIVEAFRKFIFSHGITNENSDLNLEMIETINQLFQSNKEAILSQFSSTGNERVSLDLRWGENPHMVQIMTAHASKGLEFDTVFLGGIYTNGRENNEGALFGDRPASFKWYGDLSQRLKFESPFYLYEKELSDYKNFSEAKRLFYVACTRAKKTLSWVDLNLPEKSFSIPKNSWVDGLNYWLSLQPQNLTLRQKMELDFSSLDKEKSRPQFPLFFYDSVGVCTKKGPSTQLMITTELSVTRLNSLVECPRKFYLQNILKLNDSATMPIVHHNQDDVDEVISPVSNKSRGTFVHAQIASGIEHNFIVPLESFNRPEHRAIEWTLEQLKPLRDCFEIISERPIKFQFFNFMISGIPDLILLPKNDQLAQLWDFKTGKTSQDNLTNYWLQLNVYAYALYQLKIVHFSAEIELKLIFVDQEKILTKKVSYEECHQYLFPIWQAQNTPWVVKTEHCPHCPYGDICPR